MSGFNEFSFGQNDDHIGKRGKKVKFEGGNTYRMSFIWWEGLDKGKLEMGDDDNPTPPKFVGAPIHFIEGVGYVVNKGLEYTKIAGGPPKMKIATLIVLWPTNKQGDVDKNRLLAGDAEVLPWVFSEDKYKNLKQIHKEFPFGDHDITADCKDTQFQKLALAPCKENLLKKLLGSDKTKSMVADMIADAQQMVETIQDNIGREMTIDQIKDKLSGGTGSAPDTTGATSTATTGEIDELVDDLLE